MRHFIIILLYYYCTQNVSIEITVNVKNNKLFKKIHRKGNAKITRLPNVSALFYTKLIAIHSSHGCTSQSMFTTPPLDDKRTRLQTPNGRGYIRRTDAPMDAKRTCEWAWAPNGHDNSAKRTLQ